MACEEAQRDGPAVALGSFVSGVRLARRPMAAPLLLLALAFWSHGRPRRRPGGRSSSEGLEAYDAGRLAEAATAFRQAAEGGHIEALVALAGLAQDGQGVRQD